MPFISCNVPVGVRVFDHGQDYTDRFTVIFADDAIFSMTAEGQAIYQGQNGMVPRDPLARVVSDVPPAVLETIELLRV